MRAATRSLTTTAGSGGVTTGRFTRKLVELLAEFADFEPESGHWAERRA
jgi:hypothetical protein